MLEELDLFQSFAVVVERTNGPAAIARDELQR